MPTPSNSPSSSTGGAEKQDPELFAELTERQAMPQVSQAIKGFGKKQRLIVEKVGVISRARILVKATIEAGEEEKAAFNPGFPWNLINSISLESNGVTGIIDCSGMTLEQRRRRIYRNPVSAVNVFPEALKKLKKGVYEVRFVVEVPIAHDMLSLLGSLLAQNEETSLSIDINWATEAEVVKEGKFAKFEGEVEWEATVFSIGSTTVGNKEFTVLPDLSAFHGLTDTETALQGTGPRKANLVRTSGQLLCYTASILNGPTAEISPIEWSKFAIEYGGNKHPLVWEPAMMLLEENADDYDGAINITGIHYLILDNERDNPTRDMIIPESLTELRANIGVPAVELKTNPQILTSQEILYPAV